MTHVNFSSDQGEPRDYFQSIDAVITYVARTTGASEEDAAKVVREVATFAVAQYMAEQAGRPQSQPAPQGVTMEAVKAYVDGRLAGHQEAFARQVAEGLTTATNARGARVAIARGVTVKEAVTNLRRNLGVEDDEPSKVGMPKGGLAWALDTLMLEYEDGGTFEDLSADILRVLEQHR